MADAIDEALAIALLNPFATAGEVRLYVDGGPADFAQQIDNKYRQHFVF